MASAASSTSTARRRWSPARRCCSSAPVKWIEERRESFAATIHGRGQVDYVDLAVDADGKILGLRCKIIADLGAYAQHQHRGRPDPLQPRPLGLLRHPGHLQRADRRLHHPAADRRLPRRRPPRGRPPRRADRGRRRARDRHGPGRVPAHELHRQGQVPVHHQDRRHLRLRRLRAGARQGAADRRLPAAARGAAARQRRRPEADRASASRATSRSPASARRPPAGGIGWESSTVRFEPERQGHRPDRRSRRTARGRRRPSRRSSATSWACRSTTSWSSTATPRGCSTASAPTARAGRRSAARR